MSDVVREYFKLKSQLLLTEKEHTVWKSYLHYKKYKPLYKRCNCCKNIKYISEFYKNPLKKQGVFDYCKECAKAKPKQRRKLTNADYKERERNSSKVILT